MPAPYGQDLRDRILAAYDRGKKTKEISDNFGVSPAYARRVKQVRREKLQTTRLPMGGVRVVKIEMEVLRKRVEQKPMQPFPSCMSFWAKSAAVNRPWVWRCCDLDSL